MVEVPTQNAPLRRGRQARPTTAGKFRRVAVASIDTIALNLSKNVHRWSDRMVTLYLNGNPKLVKATSA
jgi:hypothetical protein